MLIANIIIIIIITGRKINTDVEGLWCAGPQKHVKDLNSIDFYIIIIIIISFIKGIYTYIPETNNVPKEYYYYY
jgi:hypothetical protein